jgi:hypothetical protein
MVLFHGHGIEQDLCRATWTDGFRQSAHINIGAAQGFEHIEKMRSLSLAVQVGSLFNTSGLQFSAGRWDTTISVDSLFRTTNPLTALTGDNPHLRERFIIERVDEENPHFPYRMRSARFDSTQYDKEGNPLLCFTSDSGAGYSLRPEEIISIHRAGKHHTLIQSPFSGEISSNALQTEVDDLRHVAIEDYFARFQPLTIGYLSETDKLRRPEVTHALFLGVHDVPTYKEDGKPTGRHEQYLFALENGSTARVIAIKLDNVQYLAGKPGEQSAVSGSRHIKGLGALDAFAFGTPLYSRDG